MRTWWRWRTLLIGGLGKQEGEADASWNVETGLIEGPRLTEASLREELVEHPELLVWREEPAVPGGAGGSSDGDGMDAG